MMASDVDVRSSPRSVSRDVRGSVVDVLCPVKACCDDVVVVVEISHSRNSAGPAVPNCAAALPATDAAGVVVLFLLDLPICRPVLWVLGWESFALVAVAKCVGPD